MGLGDNFYKDTTPTQFETGFEQMYAKDALDCPFYNLIGNHDYHDFDADIRHSWVEGQVVGPHKYEVQLAYAKKQSLFPVEASGKMVLRGVAKR